MSTDGEQGTASAGYAAGEMARAFVTALTHEDAATRSRAEGRVGRWAEVLRGMADGSLRIGGRTPVRDLPAWVTLEVVRGGFATGRPLAGGPLPIPERVLARRCGVPPERAAIFAHHLTEAGLANLWALLDSGRYRVEIPEEAALLAVAWLVRAGEVRAALDLVDVLAPFADRLRFTPVEAATPPPDPELLARETAGQVRAALAARGPNAQVEVHREALSVWIPLADAFLSLWLDERDAAWVVRAEGLLDRYRELAAQHTRCGRHRDPKGNLAILRTATEEIVAGRELTVRHRGLVRVAVEGMLRRRGVPGSPEHRTLRARQAADAARPAHHTVAHVVAARLAAFPPDMGVADVDGPAAPVRDGEAPGIPAGTAVPPSVRRVLCRARSAPVAELVSRGVAPSAEVLAALVPQVVAATVARAYPDPALRGLVTAALSAFRLRRSVLLLDLSHQVRPEELPWLKALAPFRRDTGDSRIDARTALVDLGRLALDGFPATILPNPLVRELRTLAAAAGADLPWVDEIAADIFMGTFSQTYLRAAELAADLLAGTPYARYYDLDPAALAVARAQGLREVGRTRVSDGFARLCEERAGPPSGYGVARNGMILEQSQILTTHGLAVLAGPLGVVPSGGWEEPARRALVESIRLVARATHEERPLRTVKNAAYAWRQALFFLSMAGAGAEARFGGWATELAVGLPGLAPVVDGLVHVLNGGVLDGGVLDPRHRFLGWTAGPHRVLAGADRSS